MKLLHLCALLALCHPALCASDKSPKPPKPCTVHSPATDRYFDLNPISLTAPDPDGKKSKEDRAESWHARGYDYGANFTLNFCAPVIEKLDDVEGVKSSLRGNVSAYYEKHGKIYSIG